MENLFEQRKWDQAYSKMSFSSPPLNDAVGNWMSRYLNANAQSSCFEAGCFPGGYLSLCGKAGYVLNGIDLTPRLPEMEQWLKSQNFSIGKIEVADFFKLTPAHQFDLVYSHGFIEHFTQWKEVLLKHASWVKPGGLLLISTPNFAGSAQLLLHSWLDRENLGRHFLPSMDPALWAELLKDEFEILEQGYFGGFHFWIGEQERSLLEKFSFYSVRAAISVLKPFIPNHRTFSAYCGIAARKK